MTNEELLQSVSILLDEKLDEKLDRVLDEKLDRVLDEKLDRVLDQNLSPIREDLHDLKTRVARIEPALEDVQLQTRKLNLNMENQILPRLQTIEDCYLKTFERYQNSGNDIEVLKLEMEVVKDVVSEHSKQLHKPA